jgi:hypothetical protein
VALKDRIDMLARRNRDLEEIIQRLRFNTDSDALKVLQQLRGDQSMSFGRDASSILASHGYPENVCDSDVTQGIETAPTLQDESASSGPPSSREPEQELNFAFADIELVNLPPEHFTRRAVSAFFSCASTLFYIMSEAESEKLIRKVYHNSAGVEKSDICELCAVAAIGSQYDTDEIPDPVKESYFQHASLLLQDTVEKDIMQSMRVFICLSMFSVMAKSSSARLLIGMEVCDS